MYLPPLYIVANAHNELYAFYTGKGDLLEENSDANRGQPPPPPIPPL